MSSVRGMRNMHRELLLPVYIPTIFLSFGQGLMIPVLPLYAKQFGGSYSLAGIIVAAAWIGTTLFDLPTGLLLSRLGFRASMVIGSGIFGAATIALGLTHVVPGLILFRFVAGIGTSLWSLSRHAYITQAVPTQTRGRAISVFGGINRLGTFTGPVVGGFIANIYGLGNAIVVAGALAAVATVIAAIAKYEAAGQLAARGRHLDFGVLREAVAGNGRDVLAAGTAQIFGQMIRAGRQIVIPLFAAYAIGLDPAAVGQIVSASSLIDVMLFFPAGVIMDRFGRKAASVPSFSILSLGMALVPLTHSYWTLLAAGLLIGLGNGIGAGTMMTLGADLAPTGRTGEFLGIWRLIGDSGQAIAPLAVGAVADAIGITLTAGATAGMGVIAAGTMALFVRETRWGKDQRPPSLRDRLRRTAPSHPATSPPSSPPSPDIVSVARCGAPPDEGSDRPA